MDGNEFCRKVKMDERTSHIPVILLTARAAKESRIEGLETGADDFITKPFDGDELQVRVKNLIQQRQRIRKLLERKIQTSHSVIQIDFEDSGITSMDAQFLQKVIKIVKEHHADPQFNTKTFGQAIGLGRIQLNRKIKALTGQTTVSFIRTFRLNRAAELIKKKSATVAEIAYDVGFNSPSYFTECFREYFGKLPSEFNGNQ
jgi:YesN/AraC family two-component response regulator